MINIDMILETVDRVLAANYIALSCIHLLRVLMSHNGAVHNLSIFLSSN